MDIKNLFPSKKTECTITDPWVIDQIQNGLKAISVKFVDGVVGTSNKKIPVHYFENDRILGQGAFVDDGILKVTVMFGELNKVTPKSIGYIFKDSFFIYHNKGILKRNNKTGEENFYSEETLRNENIFNYLKLKCDNNPPDEKEDTDRSTLHSNNSELKEIEDRR